MAESVNNTNRKIQTRRKLVVKYRVGNRPTAPFFLNNKETMKDVPEWQKRQEHYEEIKRCMEETGSTFRKWNGKTTWPLIIECGHTSLDFDKCECKG